MKRIQLFEFEDFDSLPGFFRNSITELIRVFHRMFKTREVVLNVFGKVRERISFEQITDLGSGAGGIMPEVVQAMNAGDGPKVDLLLTDLYPNAKAIAAVEALSDEHIRYRREPVNAVEMAKLPAGLKTMMNSFHHLPAEVATSLLRNAQANRQPFLIYELAENKIPLLLWWLLLPLSLSILIVMVWFMTPFTKHLSLGQLLFTYLIPIIPILYAWDGQASLVRTYTFDDLREMIGEEKSNYQWIFERAYNDKGKQLGYYVLGYPVD